MKNKTLTFYPEITKNTKKIIHIMSKNLKIFLILTAIVCCGDLFSQESIVFDKRYTLDYGIGFTDGKQALDSGYIGVGYLSQSMVDDSYLIIKTDSVGNMEWYNYFGMQGSRLWGIDVTMDGDYIAAGANMDNPEWKERAVLIKYNQSGDTIWKKEYLSPNTPGDTAFSQTHFNDLICTKDTAIVAVGGCNYTDGIYHGGSGTDPFIVKTNYSGDTIWTWRAYVQNDPEYGVSNVVYFSSIAETPEGDYIAVGYSDYPVVLNNKTGPNGGVLAKFSKNGELLFFKEFHDVAYTIFSDVEIDSQGNIIVFGDKINYGEINDTESGLIVKFDADGNVLFYRLISSVKSVVGRAGCVTKNDEILFIGLLIPPDELEWFEDTWLVKYSADGDKTWEKTIGDKNSRNCMFNIEETNDYGLIMFGNHYVGDVGNKAWIVKTDSLGDGVYELGWQNSINHVQFINEVNVFPNPASNYVTIELPDLKTSFDLSIYNMAGQLVFCKENNLEKCQIFVEAYHEGIYIIKIQSDKMVYTGKLSVKH